MANAEKHSLKRLDPNQILHLTLRQLQLLGPDAGPVALCENRDDGNHPAIGNSSCGMLLVNPAGLICPICSLSGSFKTKAISTSEMTLASEAFINWLPLNAQTLRATIAAHDQWEQWGAAGGVLDTLVTRPLKSFIATLQATLARGGYPGPRIGKFPLALLLKVYNLAEHGSQTRHEILGWLETEREFNPQQHWLDALTVEESGELSFSEELHNVAIYRGKQETRFNSAERDFEQFKSQLEFISRFQRTEDEIALTTPDVTRLFPERILAQPVRQLKSIAPQLASLVEALEDKSLTEIATALQTVIHPQIASGTSTQSLRANTAERESDETD